MRKTYQCFSSIKFEKVSIKLSNVGENFRYINIILKRLSILSIFSEAFIQVNMIRLSVFFINLSKYEQYLSNSSIINGFYYMTTRFFAMKIVSKENISRVIHDTLLRLSFQLIREFIFKKGFSCQLRVGVEVG